jgi:hypothetical protein
MDVWQEHGSLPAKKNGRGETFYCFSPLIMLATMAVEGILAVYVLLRYREGRFAKVAAVLLVLLGIFQLSEYQICGSHDPQFWSHFGLVAITLLPVVGLRLVSLVSKKKHFFFIGYGIATALALIFVFVPQSITGAYCGGNYIIFSGPAALYTFFGMYYFVFLMLGIWEAVLIMRETPRKIVHRILRWFIIGYLSFMLPMGVAYAFYAPARAAVTSIMCGFAVILAFIVAFAIVPKYYQLKAPSESP